MSDLTAREMERILQYLDDDSGRGDPSSIPLEGIDGTAVIFPEADCVLSGVEAACFVFGSLSCTHSPHVSSGMKVKRDMRVLEVQGPVTSLLRGERIALNMLSRMSSIATRAASFVERISGAGHHARIAGTRKTTPGFSLFEKRALIDGGALPHRVALPDLAMIKDNHIVAMKKREISIEDMVRSVRDVHGPYLPIEVEAEDLPTALEALRAGADIIMLDNRLPEEFAEMSRAIRAEAGELRRGIVIEASGGITSENLLEYTAHADVVSMGALTRPGSEIGFKMEILP